MDVVAPPLAWLIAATVLALAELVSPGVFLIFLGIGAAVTAAMTAAIPDLPIAAQLGAFGVWSGVAVAIGRRWYADYPVGSDDMLLNDRGARMIGQVVTVEAAIDEGHGRVRVGDSVWAARGPDAAVGERVEIVAIEGAVLVVKRVSVPSGS